MESKKRSLSAAVTTEPVSVEPSSSLIMNNEVPEINLEQVQLQFSLRNEMRELLVENNKMYIFTLNNVYRIDLSNPLSALRVALPGDSIEPLTLTNVWLNPSGDFLIIQINFKSHFLLHSSYSQFKPLPRLKGLRVEFLVFSQAQELTDTGDFVASTKEGVVYVVSIKFHDPKTQGNKRDDKYVRQVYSAKLQIAGILISENNDSFQLFTAIGSKFTWSIQLATLHDLIQAFRQTPKEETIFRTDVLNHFHVLTPFYYCFSGTSGGIISNDRNVITPSSNVTDWEAYNFHLGKRSLLATDYYLLHVTSDCKSLVILSKIMHRPPLVISLSSIVGDELVLGVTEETNGQTQWLFTQNNVYEIIISNEYLSLWYSFYKTGSYENALKMVDASAETCDVWSIKNIIYVKQAYELLQQGGLGLDFSSESSKDQQHRFECLKKGIGLLAKLQEPFEKVTLMLLSTNDENRFLYTSSRELLRDYLLVKFKQAGHSEEKMNNIILSSWIVKTYLEAVQKTESYVARETFSNLSSDTLQDKTKNELKSLEASMLSFLQNNIQNIDSKTVYELMIRMGFADSLVKFAELLKDYEYIVYHHIDNESWSKAIQAMKKLHYQNSQNSSRVIFDTSFLVLLRAPQISTEFWLTLDDLDFEKLLPAILHFNQLHKTLPYSQNPIFRFFLKLIFEKGIRSLDINNQYLSLLMAHSISSDESHVIKDILKTLEFLRNILDGSGQNMAFDADFLLRTCLRFQKIEPAVSILIKEFKQYETALTLALNNGSCRLSEFVLMEFDKYSKKKGNIDTAKLSNEVNTFSGHDFSSTRLEDDSLKFRKSLWFMYARFLINCVCNGIHFDIPIIAEKSKLGHQFPCSLDEKSLATISADLKVTEKVSEAQSSLLSEVLSYLFGLSKSYGGSADLLSFKDLLPLLPESVLINHFRDDIVQSLHHYNNQINHLGLEMQESAITASKLKAQVAESNYETIKGHIYTIIEPGESCCLCRKILMEKNILVFPNCHHGCHKECAARFFLQRKGDYRFKKLFQNFKHSSDIAHKNALDDFLTRACPLCNESNLNTLDDETIDSEWSKADVADWSMSHVTFSRT